MTYGNEAEYLRILERASKMPPGPDRAGLEDLADRVKPFTRELTASEITAPMGIATRDLKGRSWPVAWAKLPPIRIAYTSPVEDIPLDVFDISNSWISPHGAVYCNGRLYVDDFRCAASWWREGGWPLWPKENIGFYGYDPATDTAVFDTDIEVVDCSTNVPYFLFNTYNGWGNFGHFVHDTLSQLLAYDDVAKRIGRKPIPILMHGFRYPIQAYLFEQLICPLSDAILLNGRAIKPAICFTSSRTLRGWEGLISVTAFRYLRERIKILRTDSGSRDNIYISRRDSAGHNMRIFENTDDLESALNARGFKSLLVSHLSPDEIIHAFSNSRFIIGVHGAGLLNAIFAPDDAHVVELWEHPFSWRTISMVFAACGIRHSVVRAIPPSETSGPLIDIPGVLNVI